VEIITSQFSAATVREICCCGLQGCLAAVCSAMSTASSSAARQNFPRALLRFDFHAGFAGNQIALRKPNALKASP